MIVQNSTLTANGTPVPAVLTEPPAAPESDVGTLRSSARQAYRDSVVAGRPLSGRELGEMFDRSERWGRDRIAEVRSQQAGGLPQETPAVLSAVVADEAASCQAAAGRQPQRGRVMAWAAFASGIAASIAANVQHAQLQTTNPAAWIGSAF